MLVHWLRKAIALWELTQVELRGHYSPERVLALTDYSERTSLPRASLVLFLTTLPCLAITTLVDCVRLDPPTEGLRANGRFFAREYFAFVMFSIIAAHQFRHNLRLLPISNARIGANGIVVAAVTVAFLYALSLLSSSVRIPFGIVTGFSVWLPALTVSLAIPWAKKLRENPGIWPMVINSIKLWMCQVALVIIYPTYFYVFTILPDGAKTPFSFLLPVIKVVMRNVFSYSVVHVHDELPEVIVSNVEVFNALFVSYGMQNSPSMWTTVLAMVIDLLQLAASLRDVSIILYELGELEEKLALERLQQIAKKAGGRSTVSRRAGSMLERVARILQQSKAPVAGVPDSSSPVTAVLNGSSVANATKGQVEFPPSDGQGVLVKTKVRASGFSSLSSHQMTKSNPLSARVAVGDPDAYRVTENAPSLQTQYLQSVQKLLYITEFVTLINFVQVIIPLVFAINLVAVYHLKNRVFYSQFTDMDEAQLHHTLVNVFFYFALQIVSLVLLGFVLKRRMHLSTIRQLSFVLERQWDQVQAKLVFWFFYNVQASLDHFVTPLPCLLITILVDCLELHPATDGLQANGAFIAREYTAFWLFGVLATLQFHHSLPSLPLSNSRIALNNVVVAALTVAVLYGVAVVVGFPVPFGIIVGTPGWVTFLSISLAIPWAKRVRANPDIRPLVVNSLKVWMCQVALVVIYPTYFFVFTILPNTGKTFFAFLLPVIKLILRNVISRTVVHLHDEIPEVVILNVEVFNALFVSYCMQNSPSMLTTIGLMVIDGLQMAVSMKDVSHALKGLNLLKGQLDKEMRGRRMAPTDHWSTMTVIERAEEVLQQHKRRNTVDDLLLRSHTSSEVERSAWPTTSTRKCQVMPKTPAPKETRSGSAGHRAAKDTEIVPADKITQIELNYVREAGRLLYITEFLILFNFVEVIIPLVFWAYLVTMYHLPNREHYMHLADMDSTQLRQTLLNVLLYCTMQLGSLVTLSLVVHYKMRFSAVHQLAFVLEKQWEQVQTKLIFWVFYNVQASLEHFGFDYSFQFPWLKNTPTQSG